MKKVETRVSQSAPKASLIFEKERVAAFSDAIIAIAITLLVLDIHPNVEALRTSHEVWQELRKLLPNMLAFTLTFWVISRFWITNQLFFKAVSKLDMRTLQYNTFFLFVIVLLPFPTKLLAAAPLIQATVIVYAITLMIASLIQAAMWHRLLMPDRRTAETAEFLVFYRVFQYYISTLIFLISIGLSYINIYLAIASWLLFGFTRLFSEQSADSLRWFEQQFIDRKTQREAKLGVNSKKPRD